MAAGDQGAQIECGATILDFGGTWAVEAGTRTTITGTHFERAGIAVSLFFGSDAPGVTDGGRNHARHNGDEAECDGVRCQRGRP